LVPNLFLDLVIVNPLKSVAHDTCEVSCNAFGINLNSSPPSILLYVFKMPQICNCVFVDIPRLRRERQKFEGLEERLGGRSGVDLGQIEYWRCRSAFVNNFECAHYRPVSPSFKRLWQMFEASGGGRKESRMARALAGLDLYTEER